MTISKSEKIKQKILDKLKGKAELSTDKGKFEKSQFTKPNKKVRRHSGRYTPLIPEKGKISEMIADAEEPPEEYDDWDNYRDHFRDSTQIRNPNLFYYEEDKEVAQKRNRKIKRQLVIRRAKKNKKSIKGESFLAEID